MTEAPVGSSPDGTLPFEDRLEWEVPEFAAVAVLLAVAVLMVGGFAAGIVASTASYGSFQPRGLVAGSAISIGASFVGPLLAVVLLGVVGLCWWQFEAWSDASTPDDDRDRGVEVAGHIQRAHRIGRWTLTALVLLCVGAGSLVVASILLSSGSSGGRTSIDWSRTIVIVANLLAVLVVSGAGFLINGKVKMADDSSD